jgi:O-succinylbenzoic acid--CoA ligase
LPHWQLQTDGDDMLSIRGDALAEGYLMRQEDAWQWQPLDGTLRTRDRVQLWQHGTRRFLRFLGRESQTLKIMGELVQLPPLQARLDALALQLGIPVRCVIVPVEDERRGTALVLASTVDAAGLMEAFNATVQPFERLQRLVLVGELPLTELGKVKLGELQTLLQR